MDALSRKTEKEKLAEMESILRDATWSGDLTDYASSTSFCSEMQTPTKGRHAPPSPHQDPMTNSPLPWRQGDWGRSGHVVDIGNSRTISVIDNSIGASGVGERDIADCTARIYSSSSSSTEEVVSPRYPQEVHHHRSPTELERRRDRHRGLVSADHEDETAAVALLRSELKATRSQLGQKDVVIKSLQRQLNQRGEIEAQTQARAEEDLVTSLAKASGLKEELARTSQLLVDGALARQNLEHRCSALAQDLHKAVTRTAELEDELSVSRAEVVRISGALHARRGTDVVDAERVFGEELQRVQETATREARGLRQEANVLRASLEHTKAKFRKACEDRDSWREEADAISSEAAALRDTVHALRQYSENETIDQLLGQMSRWKRRAEELESLQRVVSSPGSAFDSSTSETDPSVRTDPAETLDPSTPGGMTPLALAEQSASPPQDKKDGGRWVEGEREGSASALRQELCEAKETVAMMAEELAAAALAVHEEAAKRVAAEDRVESLQREAEVNDKAAREAVLARRAAKARDMANLKIALRQDMVDELHKLQREVRGQGRQDRPLGVERAASCTGTFDGDGNRAPFWADTSCQTDEIEMISASSCDGEGSVVENDTSTRGCASCSACRVDTADSAEKGGSVASRTAYTALDDQAEKRISAAPTSVAVPQAEAQAWSSAFSSARQMFHATLVSLCEQACGVLGGQGDRRQGHTASPLTGVKVSESQEASSAVVPWVPGESNTEAGMAVELLRDSIDSAVEYIRMRLAERASEVQPPVQVVSRGCQTAPGSSSGASETKGGPQPAVAAAVPRATTGSQTDGKETGELQRAQRRDAGVQAGVRDSGSAEGVLPALGGLGGAPAWEGDIDARRVEGEKGDCDRERQRKLDDDARMHELERKVGALSNALQRVETEKYRLEKTLTRRFEREQALLLEKQRHVYEADICALHASTMALVHDFHIGSAA